jgi:hypothetical protein
MMEQVDKQTIEEVLFSRGQYIGPTVGVSMLPMLKNRRDTIVVQAKTARLQRLDVALYRRGDAYILHRVLQPIDGGYIIRGDNCYVDENIPEDDVVGVLTEFFRKGKHFYCTDKKYIKYTERRLKTYKFRRVFVVLKAKCKNGARRIFYALKIRRKRK